MYLVKCSGGFYFSYNTLKVRKKKSKKKLKTKTKMNNNLFNFDFVGAKTGKVLSKTEKNIQYVFNFVISWTYRVIFYGIIAMVVLAIIKMLYHFLVS